MKPSSGTIAAVLFVLGGALMCSPLARSTSHESTRPTQESSNVRPDQHDRP